MKSLRGLGALCAALMLFLGVVFVSGCEDVDQNEIPQTGQTVVQDMNITDQTVTALGKNQPLPTFERSQERENLIRRMKQFNTPDTISYVSLINYGKIFRYCIVKGKVSSVNSLVSNPQQIAKIPTYGNSSGYSAYQMPSPDLDGSYGDNPPGAIFFYTVTGEYVEWHGDYLWTSGPQNLRTPPEVTVNIK